MSWLLLHDGPACGTWNMALDEALLEAAGDGQCALRLYAWDPPAISFGRNEPALRRYDRDAISSRGLDTVRDAVVPQALHRPPQAQDPQCRNRA